MNKLRPITNCKLHCGVCGVSFAGFSFRSSVLSDMNALRNPLRNMHQPSDCLTTILHAEIIWVANFKKNEILKSQRLNFTF